MNEANCKAGDIIILPPLVYGKHNRFTVKEVISSYIMDNGGIAIEFYDIFGKYRYYKQDFDGGEYVRVNGKKAYIDANGVDVTDIFKKYGYC